MKRLLLILALSSCITTLEMKQCGKVADEVAQEILDRGTRAGSNHAQMLKASTAGARAALGEPSRPAPVDTKNPTDGHVAVMQLISNKAIRQAQMRDYIKMAVLGALGLAGAGVGVWKGKGILSFLMSPNKIGAMAKGLVRAINQVKSIVPPELQPKVSKIAREVAREEGVKAEVDVAYEAEKAKT